MQEYQYHAIIELDMTGLDRSSYNDVIKEIQTVFLECNFMCLTLTGVYMSFSAIETDVDRVIKSIEKCSVYGRMKTLILKHTHVMEVYGLERRAYYGPFIQDANKYYASLATQILGSTVLVES